MSFWKELKRRNVYKVGVAYVIVAWLLIQAAAIVSPALQLPNWMSPVVIILLCIGLPIAILLAWAYEVTPEGIKRTKHVPLAESIRHLTGQKLMYVVVALLVVAVAFLIIDNYILERETIEPELVSTEAEQPLLVGDVEEAPKTIAVIPFVNLSPDPDQEYFVDGLSEELLNCLSKIPDLRVTSRTSSFVFKGSDKKLQEIANDLGVAHILEGSVRKAGNALRITAQLIRAEDDAHLWSETYNQELKDIFEVQEDIATSVVNELKVTLGIGKSFQQLGSTDNVEAYELYLAAKAQYNETTQNYSAPKSKIDAALALDPDFALGWALKASILQEDARFVEGDLSAKELDESLKAAQRAIELEPNLAEAYAALGSWRFRRGDWIEAELAYRKARDFGTKSALVEGSYFPFLFIVAYYDNANKILEEALRNDPLNQRIRSWYCNSLIYLGDRQRVEEEANQAVALFGEKGKNTFNIHVNFNDMSLDEVWTRSPLWPSKDQIGRIKSPEDFLVELRREYADLAVPNFYLNCLSKSAAYYGDPELAMNIMEMTVRRDSTNIIECWYPVMKEVRQLPRFKKLVKEIGLVDYWNEFGWPDICRPLDNGDFECD